MISTLLVSLLISPSVACAEHYAVDVTEVASRHRAWQGLDAPIQMTADLKASLVDWTDEDARRADTGDELDETIRLDNLLAQAACAVRNVRHGAHSELFLAEYFDRAKRGNPRRARVAVRRTNEGILIDFA